MFLRVQGVKRQSDAHGSVYAECFSSFRWFPANVVTKSTIWNEIGDPAMGFGVRIESVVGRLDSDLCCLD